MPKKLLTLDQILVILPETPLRIIELTNALKNNQFYAQPSQDEWSANELLAHLRSCADVWGDCIVKIITEDKPTIRAVNPTTYIKETNYPDLDFQSSLQTFTMQRTELLAKLERLTPEDWLQSAIFTGAGKPLERTVQFYAQWMARHERTHLKQFKKIVNTVSINN